MFTKSLESSQFSIIKFFLIEILNPDSVGVKKIIPYLFFYIFW